MNGDDFVGLDLHLELDGRRLRAGLERELRESVRSGRLKPGTRLPSSRVLATDLGIARNTVANAYTQLVAEGWLDARPGRGTSVAVTSPGATPSTAPVRSPAGPRFDLRPGVPDVCEFPREAWSSAYRRALLAEPAASLAYGDPQGHPRLRETLAAYLGRARGVNTTAHQILICNGATHGLSMLATALRQAGGTSIAMEAYCFPAYERVATTQGLRVLPLPLDRQGAILEELWQSTPAAAVLTPAHQFPTGAPLSPARRQEALHWAVATDGLLVEDDYDGEFRYAAPEVGALQASDPEHVVYARLGEQDPGAGAPARLAGGAAPMGGAAAAGSAGHRPPHERPRTTGIAEYIECAAMDRHLRTARLRYRRRREQLQNALAARSAVLALRGVPAGLHGLVDLPGGRRASLMSWPGHRRRVWPSPASANSASPHPTPTPAAS